MSNRRRQQDFTGVAFALTIVLASAAVATWYSHRLYTKKKNELENNSKSPDDSDFTLTRDPTVPKEVFNAFKEAAARIRKSESLSTGEKLVVYALFKQSTAGDSPAQFSFLPGNSWNIVAEQAKYSAWSKMRGMPKTEAMIRYVTAVEDIEAHGETGEDEDEMFARGFAPTMSLPAVENGPGYDESKEGSGSMDPSTRLLRAASEDNVSIVEEVLKSGAVTADHADETGQTALHLAADRGSFSVVSKLLDHGANPNKADNDGISVLQAAVISGNVKTCLLLLDKGADPDQADHDGDTPRSCADEDGSTEMKDLFLSKTSM
jgi:acyl-CoA-binding protein